jgi:uncharacterized protein DUF3631
MESTITKLVAASVIPEIEAYLKRYVAFPDGILPLPIALWVVGTHLYEVFDAYAYLVITAATKRAGKTRLMELLSFLCARSYRTADITPAALYSIIEDDQPTLMIDEAERFAVSRNEFRAIVNSGYRRGETVIRRQGNDVRQFRLYCPKVFVLIGDVFDTLRDRSAMVTLRRGHAPERFVYTDAKRRGSELKEKIESLVSSSAEDIASSYETLPSLGFLTDREEEIWSPLFAICRVLCPERWDELVRTAVDISTLKTAAPRKHFELPAHEDAEQQIEYGERAVRDLVQVIVNQSKTSIRSIDAIAALRDLPTGPWRTFKGEGLKPNIEGSMALASLLEPFGIRPTTIRLRPRSEGALGSTAKGYKLADLKEAAKKTGVFP